MIEVEVRGKIEDLDKTILKFRNKAKFVKEKDRFSLIYLSKKDVKDVREIKDDPIDLKVRVTNKKAELVLKYGIWGPSENRKEIEIPIDLDKFGDMVELLSLLGWKDAVIMPTKTFVFDYKGIEFALVKGPGANYFEAEKIVKTEAEIENARKEILDACKEFNLKLFSDDEFMDMMNECNNAPNCRVDLRKQNFEDIKKIFKEFF